MHVEEWSFRHSTPSQRRLLRIYSPNLESRPIPLRTLYQGWLTEEDYVDLSDARGIIVDPQTKTALGQSRDTPYLTYGRSEHRTADAWHIKHFPFPVNSHGYFFYRKHLKFPIAGALRFRLTQGPRPYPEKFSEGTDLLNEYGARWQIPLLVLASSPRYKYVQEVLRRDGFLLDGVLEHLQDMCKRVEATRLIGEFGQFVYDTRQPFVLNLARPKSCITLVGEKDLISVDQVDLFAMRPLGKPFKCVYPDTRRPRFPRFVKMTDPD